MDISYSILLCISLVLGEVLITAGQTTPFDEYSEVSVLDQEPIIDPSQDKIYTTSLNLVKSSAAVTFVASQFISEADNFYSGVLQGFLQVNNVQNEDLANNVIRVTYDVNYEFAVLTGAVNGNDTLISSTIGSFTFVRTGLNQQPILFSLYPVENDPSTFSFGGSSMCSVATCEGNYVSCVETSAGIDVTCVSSCKAGYCYNGAICAQSDPNVVPVCHCKVLPDVWFLGDRCQTEIALWLIILLSVIGFLIIVIVIIIVCCCVVRKKRRRREKEKLANMPLSNGVQNKAFVEDQDRITAKAVPQLNLVPRSNPALSLDRDDSFETVTSDGNSRRYDRNSYATSRTGSTHHNHHHHHHDRHHHHHHRDRHRHRHHRSRSREHERHHRRSRTSSSSENESSEPETNDEKNLSFYEVDVTSLDGDDTETEAPASVVTTPSTTTSPIRWLPPKRIESRPGWVPSLGPLMYDLKRSTDNLAATDNEPGYATVEYGRQAEGETNL